MKTHVITKQTRTDFEAIHAVAKAVSKDPGKPTLQYMFIRKGVAYGSDGHRMHWHTLIENPGHETIEDGNYKIKATASQLILTPGDEDATPPDFEQFIPSKFNHEVDIPRYCVLNKRERIEGVGEIFVAGALALNAPWKVNAQFLIDAMPLMSDKMSLLTNEERIVFIKKYEDYYSGAIIMPISLAR